MKLVSIQSGAEQARIAYYLGSIKNSYSSSFWTDGTYQYYPAPAGVSARSSYYQWVWGSTQTAISYTSWAPLNPSNELGSNYLTLDYTAPFNWVNDVNVDFSGNPIGRYFICEF